MRCGAALPRAEGQSELSDHTPVVDRVRVRVTAQKHLKLVKELPHLHYLIDQVKYFWMPYLLDALMPYLSSNLDPWILDRTSVAGTSSKM